MGRQPDRVLMLVENNPYPQDPRVRREARALVEAGYQVTVISPARKRQPLSEIVDGVRVYRYPELHLGSGVLGYLWEYGYSMATMSVASAVALLREGFDVVHTANPPDTLAFIAAAYKLLGKKFVYDHHDLSPEMYFARFGGKGSRLVYRVLMALEQFSCRLADHVIATNESYKAVEMERGGVPESRITIVRNGPDLSRAQEMEPDPALRQMGKTIIAFAGVMGTQDGVDYLLRALHHLIHEVGRDDFFCLLIGGSGDARPSLQQLASELGLDQHVRFTGWVSDTDWQRYLASADICVDPDPSNPFNDRSTMIKMTEYMAAGKPIVAFDLPEHRFTARDAALYVQPNDEREMARALARLMDDPACRHSMGDFGRQRVMDQLAWQHSVPGLLSVYDRLLPLPSRQLRRGSRRVA